MNVKPREPNGLPSKCLAAVLLLAIALKRLGVGVIGPSVNLDQESMLNVGKVRPTHESAAIVEHLELRSRQLDIPIKQDAKKAILEKALSPPIDTSVHFEQWPNDADATPTSLRDALHEDVHIGDREELLSQSLAEGAFDEPWARCTQVNNRSLRIGDGNPIQQSSVRRNEVKGLVHTYSILVCPVPTPERHLGNPRGSPDESPLERC